MVNFVFTRNAKILDSPIFCMQMILFFSNGSRHSLSGITSVLADFKLMSGLKMNAAKPQIFFGGYNDVEVAVLSDLAGIKSGTFPRRYLWLPMNPKRISMATLQPLMERITSILHCWTVKTLPYAGKIRLIASEVYGWSTFGAHFNLPKTFYARVDSLCAAFYGITVLPWPQVQELHGKIFVNPKLNVDQGLCCLRISKWFLDLKGSRISSLIVAHFGLLGSGIIFSRGRVTG